MENSFLIQTKDEASFKVLIKDAVLEALKEISPAKQAERYLTRAEVAKEYHVSLVSVDKAIDDGRLKSYRFGGRVLFKASELDLQEVKFRHKKQI